EAMKKHQAEITVREVLVELNEPLFQEKTKNLYLQLARVRGKNKFESKKMEFRIHFFEGNIV
ncbi:MAG: hypothetical protein ABIP06_11070, partial [Pyrinomonadaceae bacterium]